MPRQVGYSHRVSINGQRGRAGQRVLGTNNTFIHRQLVEVGQWITHRQLSCRIQVFDCVRRPVIATGKIMQRQIASAGRVFVTTLPGNGHHVA